MRRGIAVSTTMFMLLVIYFLATLIVWQAHANLGFTRLNSEQTRRTLAAQGMINEFIANMTRDPNYEPNHGPDRPVVARDRGVEYRTWAVPDRQYGSVVHVICRARGVGAAGTQVSRIVRKKPNIANVLYSDVNSSGVPDIR